MADEPMPPDEQEEPRPKKAGRPSKFTPELAERIITYVTAGQTIKDASHLAGIHTDTLYEWLSIANRDRNRGKDSEYARFSVNIDRAYATANARLVSYIEIAARGTPGQPARPAIPATDGRPAVPATPAIPGQPGDWRAAAWAIARRDRANWGSTWDRRDAIDEGGQEDAGALIAEGLVGLLGAAFRSRNGGAGPGAGGAMAQRPRALPLGRVGDPNVEPAGRDDDGGGEEPEDDGA